MDRLALAEDGEALPLHAVDRASLSSWVDAAPETWRAWLNETGFKASDGEIACLPGADGRLEAALVGLGDGPTLWSLSRLSSGLPARTYRFMPGDSGLKADDAALGWALGAYRFDRFSTERNSTELARLVWPEGADRTLVKAAADATFLARDLINRPANDLTPAALAAEVRAIAEAHGASVSEIVGEDLLTHNYPAVHVVGRAGEVPPRLIDVRWGREDAPKLTIVGKGVVFDSGGLDLKPSGGMRLMKKDMGGAAHALGLAHMIMATGLDVRLRLLVPAVENSVSDRSFRPLDVIQTRKGLTVEVGNTDAEGRLILADALHEAASEKPEAIVDFATLTGAARVALGTELPALFCNDDGLAGEILTGADAVQDSLWRMPLWQAYRRHLNSPVADISSTGEVPTGGAITAALFLERFVEPKTPWVHVDVMAWNNGDRPGRPKGGDAMGMRGMYAGLMSFMEKTG
ncbi:MAG: leucyl aminopeptidase family protein [Pseudomonadota bacterium]